MKRSTKFGLGLAALAFSAVALTSCTNSFCSTKDKSQILYAFDGGVTEYFATQEERDARALEVENELVENFTFSRGDVSVNVYTLSSLSLGEAGYLSNILSNAQSSQGLSVPTIQYYQCFDNYVLERAATADFEAHPEYYTSTDVFYQNGGILDLGNNKGLLIRSGYVKFYGDQLWNNWNDIDQDVRSSGKVLLEDCPTTDFISYYQSSMASAISSYRSCLATSTGYYGHYNNREVEIEAKSYGYAWKTGFLSGLLVYPIGWMIDTFTNGMLKGGVANGWAQLLAILFVTLIVRALMLLVTFRQTTATSKMQALQPEIAKIQAKYPNANTNQYEKQRLAEETQKLYKKNKINPLTSILVMIVQFPVFICVWSAMQGSAYLSSGSFLGLDLSTSISSVLTTWSNWKNPASGVWTALVLFLLMAGAQAVAMLLPQWMQKAQKKKIAKLGRNPAAKESDKKSKIFTYVMLIMIIFMGFSLVSALGVYWLVGALFSIAQTLITQLVMNHKKTKKQK